MAWTWGHKLRAVLARHSVGNDTRRRRRLALDAARTKGGHVSAPSGDRPGPCGCAKLLRRDWGWPNDLEEEREVARLELRRALGGRPIPVETVPEDAPPSSDAFTHWELLATYKGSLSEKHLRAYLDEHAFRNNRRDEVVAERFLRVARALPDTPPRSYREIIVRPQPTGLALSIFDVGA